MAVLLKPLHPSARGFERLSIGNGDFPIMEQLENLSMVPGLCRGELAQGLVDLFVFRVPPYWLLRLETLLGHSRFLGEHLS
jgi:hypothetical protein